MSKLPLVSIVIPTFKPRHFEAALLSAVSQSYQALEILVSDDCPTDDIQRILARHLGRNNRDIRVIRNQPGLGGLMNYTQCVVEARGDFVKFLNDDDILLGDCVERMIDVFLANPGVTLVTSRRLLIDESGLPLPDMPASCNPFKQDTVVRGSDLISYLANSPMNFIGEPSTVMFRREHLADITPNVCCLDGQTVRAINDLAMYVNVLRHGDMAYLCDALSCFRKHAEQRQQQGDMLPLWRKGVQVFSSQIRSMGLYRPQSEGQVLCRALSGPDEDWNLFPLRLRLAEEAERLKLVEEAPQSSVEAFPSQCDAGGVPLPEPAKPELQRWFEARLPTPVQNRMINDYLCRHDGGPRLGIMVLDLQGDTQKLMATIRSLGLERGLYATLKIVVLTVGEVPVTHSDSKLHFVCVDACSYVTTMNSLVSSADWDWLMLVDAGEEFAPSGLMMMALELLGGSGCRAVYGDELQRLPDGSLGAAFRPGFNLDLLLSFPALMARHWLFSRKVFIEAGGFDSRFAGALEFELLLRLIEREGMSGLGHVDEPLLITAAPALVDSVDEQNALLEHLQRRGYVNAELRASLPGRYRVSYGHPQQPLVSIIIPTKDQLPVLQRCVESLLERTHYSNYEVLIVDNASQTPEALSWLAAVEQMGEDKVRVLRYPHPFNYSAINNMAAREARGEYLVLLNNDTAIISETWLDELLNHAQRPEVGVVGAKLLYPDGKIQHAGVVLGLRGPADHPFIGEPMDAPGYMQRLQVDQNYSAVTAACLMIRKSVYEEVDGLDELSFKVSYNDVDLCLKVREAGHLIVWTPHAVVMHEGSVSQTRIDPKAADAKRKRFAGEQDLMYEKWLPALANDPAYNRNLSLNGRAFELEPDVQLTWRPLTWRPVPVVLAHPADPWGCGNYRVMRPFRALRDSGQIDGMLSHGLLQVVDLQRYDPDVIILQRQIGDDRLEAMRRIKAFSRAFKVYELDDYLPNLPMKSVHRENMPKDILRSLRRGLGYVDRFVVSTDALAEAFGGLHDDIVVAKNCLPKEWWDNLSSQRRRGQKPRIGWAGGSSHTGDLGLIVDVVKELADEVEWVFFGMCPAEILPYVKEIHAGVDIDLYPQALARLDLDLALAPVEQNLFNECKSNLRLLEYGACGFPVVCSDIRCYQGDLPVTRVKNRFKDWVDAIRMHISDLDATAKLGDQLHAKVKAEWMLDGENLERWRQAWALN
ncbi:glycosyltransferase [Pseudomonas sp. BMS12]|uniref:glycosyltransferase n=1 Tax=Pseudomonas sp. BMS12 TaxID=1796033 RepID=UPI00083B3BDA|nr:glycosyltransferase [Pseudomonas sp. BMS12]